jgi:hypothetical protein
MARALLVSAGMSNSLLVGALLLFALLVGALLPLIFSARTALRRTTQLIEQLQETTKRTSSIVDVVADNRDSLREAMVALGHVSSTAVGASQTARRGLRIVDVVIPALVAAVHAFMAARQQADPATAEAPPAQASDTDTSATAAAATPPAGAANRRGPADASHAGSAARDPTRTRGKLSAEKLRRPG